MPSPAGQRRQRPLTLTDPRTSKRSRQGLAPVEVRALYASQDGRCAICAVPLGSRFTIDHDHFVAAADGHDVRTGCRRCVRGAICYRCNRGLAVFERHGPDVMARAAAYAARRRPGAAA